MHDSRGKELKVGDVVLIPCIVEELYPTDEYCNVNLVTQIGRRPDGMKEHISAINTGVLIKVGNDVD